MHFVDTLNFGHVGWEQMTWVVLFLILLALFFDFLNGFHDAANSIATVVSTRVLSPHMAVIWAAFFNFIAFLAFALTIAETMGKGIIDVKVVDPSVVAATLIAACAWDLITWYYGLPTSSSHALIGGMVGAALAKVGFSALVWEWGLKTLPSTICFILIAPMIGLLAGVFIAVAVSWLFRRATPRNVDGWFRRGQLLSAAFYSLGHGGNDAQKTMGIIFMLLIATHAPLATNDAGKQLVPTEVVLACHIAMGLGTLFGGWRIVKTMGQRLIKLKPVDGFCAEAAGALTLLLTIFAGVPVSTTHTITGAIVGVGSARYRFRSVRWSVAGRVVWAWVLTIPGSAVIAAASWYLVRWIL
jgi:PiT family inorganic phosphate transporter